MIIYAVICRLSDATVLVDCVSSSDIGSNAPQVTKALVEHMRDNPHLISDGDRKTFVQRNETPPKTTTNANGGGASNSNNNNPNPNDLDYYFSYFLESACTAALGGDGDDDDIEEYFFHLFLKDGVLYGCIGDDPDTHDQKVNFAFLDQIKKEFTKLYRQRRIKNAKAMEMDQVFKPNFRRNLHYYNVNHKQLSQEDSVRKILAEAEDIKYVMGKNMLQLLETTDHIKTLVEKSEEMRNDAKVFKRRAKRLQRKQQFKYFFTSFILVLFVLLGILITSVGICGIRFQRCRAKVDEYVNGDGNDGGDQVDNGEN